MERVVRLAARSSSPTASTGVGDHAPDPSTDLLSIGTTREETPGDETPGDETAAEETAEEETAASDGDARDSVLLSVTVTFSI